MGDDTGGGTSTDVFDAKNRLGGIGLVRDPHPRLHELRDACPVHRGSVSGIFGIVGPDNYLTPDEAQVSVFTFDEVDRGFRDATTFSNAYYVPSLRAVIGRTILEMDPPEHQRYRSLLQGAFTKHEMIRWEDDFVRGIVSAQLDALAPRGRMVIEEPDVTHRSVKLIAWMERLLLMGSRFLTPRQLAALFQATGAQRVDVHLDEMHAQLVIEKRV